MPLPHYLTPTASSSGATDSALFANTPLRFGEVIDIIYTDDDRNTTKSPRQTQYRVRVQRQNGKNKSVTEDYICVTADLFGGVGDRFRATRRKATRIDKDDPITNGSRVLVLCLNAHTGSAVIVGGLKHRKAETDPGKNAGDNLLWEFNGIQFTINNDGEVTLVNQGATDQDGKPRNRDAANKGTQIKLLKNGSVRVENKSGEVIEIDTANRKINMTSKNQSTSTEESWTLTAGKNFTVDAGADARIGAGGTLKLGGSGASENLVLGQKLAEALRALLTEVVLPNSMTWGTMMGAPIQVNPAVVQSLSQWVSKYLSGSVPAILAEKKFTER